MVEDARRAIKGNDEAALRDAIRRGADVNGMVPCDNEATGTSGHFPLLCLAASEEAAGLCEILLAAGADLNLRATTNGALALHDAALTGNVACTLRLAIVEGHREVALTLLRAGAAITALRRAEITPENGALHDYMVDIMDKGGWNARVERHRRPLMSILSNLALPHDALVVVLSFWSPPGGR